MAAPLRWREWAKDLAREVVVLYLASKDRRTKWFAKVVALSVVAYALSPIDLIPDPIPILGYLDDLIIIPLGILLARKLIQPEILADCRLKAEQMITAKFRGRWVAASVILVLWLVLILALYVLLLPLLR